MLGHDLKLEKYPDNKYLRKTHVVNTARANTGNIAASDDHRIPSPNGSKHLQQPGIFGCTGLGDTSVDACCKATKNRRLARSA